MNSFFFKRTNNSLIENVFSFSNETKNSETRKIRKVIKAKFKIDEEDELKDEIIYDLMSNEINRIESMNQKISKHKCKCMRKCFFTESNMALIHYSK